MERLGELAKIRTGYPFRGSIERIERGGCRLVQMGDVRATTAVVGEELAHVEPPANWENHRLHHGDVLFLGRGIRNDAATFVGRADDVIAAPHLFVLRAKEHVVLPDYLTWFLNLPETQDLIRSLRAGSAVPFVPMDAFSRLELPLPSFKMQNHLVGIHRLCLQEQRLLEEIVNRRRVLIDGLMSKALRQECGDGVADSRKPIADNGIVF